MLLKDIAALRIESISGFQDIGNKKGKSLYFVRAYATDKRDGSYNTEQTEVVSETGQTRKDAKNHVDDLVKRVSQKYGRKVIILPEINVRDATPRERDAFLLSKAKHPVDDRGPSIRRTYRRWS